MNILLGFHTGGEFLVADPMIPDPMTQGGPYRAPMELRHCLSMEAQRFFFFRRNVVCDV